MRLTEALSLSEGGRFAEALTLIDEGPIGTADRLHADILRIELLERVGEYTRARLLSEKALRQKTLPAIYQSDCRFTLGRMELFQGNRQSGLEQCSLALQLAKDARDAKRACWIQLWLMLLTCDKISAEAAARWISQVRLDTARLGDPVVSAALHIFVGEIAGKHGAKHTSKRHTVLGLKLLDTKPNVWLQAWAENTLVALALMEGDLKTGMKHAVTASTAAELSGAATTRIASLGNLGNLAVLEGAWEQALGHYSHASEIARVSSEQHRSVLESLARLRLLENRYSDAHELLDTIDASPVDTEAAPYAYRHSQLTRAVLFAAERRLNEALSQVDATKRLADTAGDRVLQMHTELVRTELLSIKGESKAFILSLDGLRPSLPLLPVELRGQYERLLGSATLATAPSESGAHFRRALRVFSALGHQAGVAKTKEAAAQLSHEAIETSDRLRLNGVSSAGQTAQDILTILLHAGRPELLATDIIEVLASTNCVARATAVARDDDGRIQPIASHMAPLPEASVPSLPARTYELGRTGDRTVEISCEPLQSVEAVATVNAVASLLEVVRDLDAARVEREERLGLWPIEEFPDSEEDAVISGAMREVMRLARKVAATNATVLITGESGTGKEIVARAIHRWGTKPGQPYVPFNCTAVPRDLLESHLFGYRRGAFTGAERDHPGVIRSAKEGTLFLDEIGELSLESQPKLLRFLESQEVHPLGETEPVRVKTRVVAATNANLETLVREGRFRSDLFYRLNVVPIGIPPLRERRDEIPDLALHFVARAAQDYGKGQIRVDDEVLELLTLHAWPGNVRQLNNELRRIIALADNDVTLTADMLPLEIRRPHRGHADEPLSVAPRETLASALARVEKQMIAAALKSCRGSLDATAKALGISRKGLYLKRLRFGL